MTLLGEAPGPRPSRLGRYELITQIGQGGMAEVQLALQRGPAGFEKLVVVKLVHPHLATQKSFVDMLLEEARLAAMVKHPNVVDIYDLGHSDGRYFIAMEYLEGEPLLAVLRAGRDGNRLDVLSTARMIADTAEGLDAAHELRNLAGDAIELVHHDISLGNIVVLYNGQVKLVDFGVAKATQTAGPQVRVQGKFSYMAPEKLRGSPGDRRSDIWSLGCVLWEALTLRRLFKGATDEEIMRQVLDTKIALPSTINADVPRDFDPIVMKALERDPAKRFTSAKQLASALEEVLRQRKYGGKNEQIAKYMQATFAAHIVARKKLLQEVSSAGRASPDVLVAAFDAPPLPGAPAASPEFSVRIKRATGELLTNEQAELRARTNSFAPPYARTTGSLAQGEVLMPGTGTAALRPGKDRRVAVVVGTSAAVMLVVLAIVFGTRGSKASEHPPRPGSAARVTEPVDSKAPVADPAAAEALFKEGMQAYVKGDSKGAIGTFRRALQADPGYAAGWRALGLAHEKLGEWGQAKTALGKYLELAPSAPDVEQIKERIGNL